METKYFALALNLLLFKLTLFAQNPTIHDPTVTPTITDEQIASWGHTSPDKSGNVLLDFEGAGNNDPILEFYNGGTSQAGHSGTNFGVSFSESARALISNQEGGTGNFSNNPLGRTVMYYSGAAPYMNVANGFETELSFYYASSETVTIEIYDGQDGTGDLLASKNLPSTPNTYTVWEKASISFNGTARSVLFSGGSGHTAFDAVTLDSMASEPHSVPISLKALLIPVLLIVGFAIAKAFRFF